MKPSIVNSNVIIM